MQDSRQELGAIRAVPAADGERGTHADPCVGQNKASDKRGDMDVADVGKTTRVRRALRAIHRAGDFIDNALSRMWEWLLRMVLRTARAFLAGAGAFSLPFLIIALSLGIDTVRTLTTLTATVTGGLLGVVIQRTFKKFAWLRKIALAIGVEAISDMS